MRLSKDFLLFKNCFLFVILIIALPFKVLTNVSNRPTSINILDDKSINEMSNDLKKIINKTVEEVGKDLHDLEDKVVKNITTLLQMPDPWNIDTIKPKIVFYKIENKNYEVDYDSKPKDVANHLNKFGFLDTERLIILTHGFHNNFNTPWLHEFKDTILNNSAQRKEPQTVAILGWGGGADILVFRYRQAASNIVPVGDWLADYIKAIKDIKPNLNIYAVGHSLGAHALGRAGRVSKGFDRITGLDPAGPCFEKVENSPTLRASDASFVDVIHTDGYDSKLDPSEWFFPVNHYGSLVPIGTLDFYPNYGYHQPGAGAFKVAGSHLRALELFQWSINNRGKFVTDLVLSATPDFDDPVESSVQSKFKAEMGFYADRWPVPPLNESTLYYIKTNKDVPWD